MSDTKNLPLPLMGRRLGGRKTNPVRGLEGTAPLGAGQRRS